MKITRGIWLGWAAFLALYSIHHTDPWETSLSAFICAVCIAMAHKEKY